MAGNSQILKEKATLKKNTNILFIEDVVTATGWCIIRENPYASDNSDGYTLKKNIRKGWYMTDTNSWRVGANCCDGTTSGATGRGACSRHGGVCQWLTKSTTRSYIQE